MEMRQEGRTDMQNAKVEEMRAGDVRVFRHTDVVPAGLEAAASYWQRTMATFGFANGADFDIHVWDREDFSHLEVGVRLYGRKGFDGTVARALVVMDMMKASGRGLVLLCPPSNPWHEDVKGFAEDTMALLERDYGWKGFMTMDMDEFETKFFRFEPMLLAEDGRRMSRGGDVLLDDGSRTFGLTSKAVVDMLL